MSPLSRQQSFPHQVKRICRDPSFVTLMSFSAKLSLPARFFSHCFGSHGRTLNYFCNRLRTAKWYVTWLVSNHDRSNHDRRIMSENPGVYIAIKSAVRRLLHKRSKVKGICMKGDRKNIISYYSSAFTINPEPRHRSVRSHSVLLCMCTHVHAETYYYWDIGSVTWSK